MKIDVRIAAAPAIHSTLSENTRFNTAIYVSPTKKKYLIYYKDKSTVKKDNYTKNTK
ncbi:hypothetical protein LCR01_04180 [Companilactobacillus crustorum]|uniref:Uncharacterized protein n=1 Tax=Companilactobacillus crustorum TaxID=392416 RepID=A0AB34A8Y8_9LACO|nr:hypothetical protein LCR01_04180 [Companilactobacillus crustorum]